MRLQSYAKHKKMPIIMVDTYGSKIFWMKTCVGKVSQCGKSVDSLPKPVTLLYCVNIT